MPSCSRPPTRRSPTAACCRGRSERRRSGRARGGRPRRPPRRRGGALRRARRPLAAAAARPRRRVAPPGARGPRRVGAGRIAAGGSRSSASTADRSSRATPCRCSSRPASSPGRAARPRPARPVVDSRPGAGWTSETGRSPRNRPASVPVSDGATGVQPRRDAASSARRPRALRRAVPLRRPRLRRTSSRCRCRRTSPSWRPARVAGGRRVAGEARGLGCRDPRQRRVAGEPERRTPAEQARVDADAVAEVGDRARLDDGRRRLRPVRAARRGRRRACDGGSPLQRDSSTPIPWLRYGIVPGRRRNGRRRRRRPAVHVHELRVRPAGEQRSDGGERRGRRASSVVVVMSFMSCVLLDRSTMRRGYEAVTCRRSPMRHSVCNACRHNMEWRLFEGIPARTCAPCSRSRAELPIGAARSSFTTTTRPTRCTSSSKGRFDVRITTTHGDVVALAIRGPGETFGEIAVVTGAERSATVTALEPGETLVLRGSELRRLAREHAIGRRGARPHARRARRPSLRTARRGVHRRRGDARRAAGARAGSRLRRLAARRRSR